VTLYWALGAPVITMSAERLSEPIRDLSICESRASLHRIGG
jgi:hypothetical protein